MLASMTFACKSAPTTAFLRLVGGQKNVMGTYTPHADIMLKLVQNIRLREHSIFACAVLQPEVIQNDLGACRNAGIKNYFYSSVALRCNAGIEIICVFDYVGNKGSQLCE